MSWTTQYPWLHFPRQFFANTRSRARLKSYQQSRLQQLLQHATERVPFYSQQQLPPDARSLHRWPVVKKDDLRRSGLQLLSRDLAPKQLITHRSSGSTGSPVVLYRSWHEERALGLLRMRAQHHWGVRWHHRRLALRPGHFNWDRNLVLEFLDRLGLYRLATVSCFQSPEAIYRRLARLKPDYLGGYPQVLEGLSGWMLEHGAAPLPTRWVAAGGELFTHLARQRIQRAFPQAWVGETYGSIEFNLIAWQCPQQPWLHLCEDGVHVEILDDQDAPVAPGQPGRLVGTALQSFAMPLIRFDLGDRVVAGPSPCPCGRPFATLARVQGRQLDTFWFPDGSSLHPFELTNPLVERCELEWLQRYQLVQEQPDRLVFRFQADAVPSGQQLETVRQVLQEVLGSRARLDLQQVNEFEAGVAGKFRYFRPLPGGS